MISECTVDQGHDQVLHRKKNVPTAFLEIKQLICYVHGCVQIPLLFYMHFVHFVVPMGISPMGNLGHFPEGKPAATE